MDKDVIVACDFSNKEEVKYFLSKFTEEKPYVKIGMELFYREGPEIIKLISSMGHKIFLDLKLHDIPNTVKKTMRVLSGQNIQMVNLHAAGSIPMMEAALEGLTREDGSRPLLIAVTQLTSIDEETMKRDILIDKPLEEVVIHYARCAKKAGLDGVVCSPLEAERVHTACGIEFLTVTPGIRFEGNEPGDQKRVTTPAMAKISGSDYIVVGRPVTEAKDPVEAYRRCLREFTV